METGDNFKVDKHFWGMFLCRYWRLCIMSTEKYYNFKVDIEDHALFKYQW